MTTHEGTDTAVKPAPESAAGETAGGRIRVLPPAEARKIAAGEVIDRPAALIREFLDNAIDADARNIEVYIEEGGIKRTEVVDNGSGMSREDLLVCRLPHATSKIRSLEDLAVLRTLGFRGEALAAAAAVTRLEILTSRDGREAWLLESEPDGAEPAVTQSRRTRGTTVRALGLFDAVPARKRFLKREGSEGGLCRQAFTDKALAFPERSFRFTQDGGLKDYFPPSGLKERFAAILLKPGEETFLHEISAPGGDFTVTVIAGGPELYRNDKRRQYIFVNRRRIYDYGLLQALEYGLQGWFPNGSHPVGAVYIDIDPRQADFNVHPAKREVRFADAGTIHHALTTALRDFVRHLYGSPGRRSGEFSGGQDLFAAESGAPYMTGREEGGMSGGNGPAGRYAGGAGTGGAGRFGAGHAEALAMEALLENPPRFSPLPGRNGETRNETHPGETLRYAGRIFGLFILAERGDRLFIIDQHAAHERILYDRFLSGPVPRQELLVPIPFETESGEDDSFLLAHSEELGRLGITLERDGKAWRIAALPSGWRTGDRETVKEILSLKNAGKNIAEHWAATLACHTAVRDGDYLDQESALALAGEALALPMPFCPHGRPLWMELNRGTLLKAVKRE
ncbi:MAG: DNA mismatch repair endonuclease MutL [Treponema sp.]|jgi:DNA mismatch repair protein MutL|nr:DNA mismatch repair endonuclease MutL [Treponema sp.]